MDDRNKIIGILINKAEKDIKADELLGNDVNFKKDPLRLFLLQQASEKIIKAWLLKNIEAIEPISQFINEIKIDSEAIENLSGIRDEENEKLFIISNFQKEAFEDYKSLIEKITKNNFNYFLKKELNHNPVKNYLSRVLKILNDLLKFFSLIPDDIILKYSKENNIISTIENTKDFSKELIKFIDDIIKQLSIKNPNEIIQNLELVYKKEESKNSKVDAPNGSTKVSNKDNIDIILQAEDFKSIAIVVIVVLALMAISKMSEKDKEKLDIRLFIFYNLYIILQILRIFLDMMKYRMKILPIKIAMI